MTNKEQAQILSSLVKSSLLKHIKAAENLEVGPKVTDFFYDLLLLQNTLEQLKTIKLRIFFIGVLTLATCSMSKFIELAEICQAMIYREAAKILVKVAK